MGPNFAAVALAGGALEADFRAAGYNVVNKAYLKIGEATMLERVLRALPGAARVSHIRCVTPIDAFRATFGDPRAIGIDVVAPGQNLVDSLIAGLPGLNPDDVVLVCATAIPLATSAAIDAFAAKAAEFDCDIGYGYVSRDAHLRKFPQVRH